MNSKDVEKKEMEKVTGGKNENEYADENGKMCKSNIFVEPEDELDETDLASGNVEGQLGYHHKPKRHRRKQK